jgi:hypothetical protein
MTAQQCDALAKLLRLRGAIAGGARLVMADRMGVPEASRATNLDLRLAHRAVENARAGLALVLLQCRCRPRHVLWI